MQTWPLNAECRDATSNRLDRFVGASTLEKIGRNQPCPCGSGKKYKKCHGSLATGSNPFMPSPERVEHVFEQMKAAQRIREAQQGLGRPIISAKSHGQQLVAVGNRLFHSSSWKTFPDFLNDYLKGILDPAWGNAEIAKPFAERHTVMQWYDAVCRFQQKMIKVPGEVHNSTMPGVVICFLGLAYNLYLLGHNVELQNRLIRRLKDPGNFQGAYYELIVANTLIRAGFKLTLEDETDGTSKHCEFAAVSQRTGKKYWVEAKMRAVRGFFGKGDHDGSVDPNPISHLIPHLNGALAKRAADERLIFIDLNTDAEAGKPAWVEKAATRLERYETEKPSSQAYVFVTNMPFHHSLNHDVVPVSILPFGLGMKDFGRPGYRRLSEMYRTKQKHRDAHDIAEAMTRYPQIPSTFDGALPSESFGRTSSRVLIGETYNFEGLGEGGVIGTVTTATVSEVEKQAYIGIVDQRGQGQILRAPMSEGELADYKAHPDAYFGRIQPVQKKIESRYELFEWFMEAHKALPRERILESFKQAPNLEELKSSVMKNCALFCAKAWRHRFLSPEMPPRRSARRIVRGRLPKAHPFQRLRTPVCASRHRFHREAPRRPLRCRSVRLEAGRAPHGRLL